MRSRASLFGCFRWIIAKLNELFSGELADNDKVPYICSVIRGKLMESSTLQQQAAANSKEQFSPSADRSKALLDAIIGALDAHPVMSTPGSQLSRRA